MTKIEAEVPGAIYRQAVEMAKKENVPVTRLVSLALAQALGAWQSESIISERAKRGSRENFLPFCPKRRMSNLRNTTGCRRN